MALTVDQLRNAVRAGGSAEETEILTRLLAVGVEVVERHAPDAPEQVRDEATIRFAAYLFDQPNAGRGVGFANALRHSGAQALLTFWRVRRAGVIGERTAAGAPAGVAGLSEEEVRAIVAEVVPAWARAATPPEIPDPPAPYVLPAATADTRGGVKAVTAAIIDAGTSTGVFGWALSHVRRAAQAVVGAASAGIAGKLAGLDALTKDLYRTAAPATWAAAGSSFLALGADLASPETLTFTRTALAKPGGGWPSAERYLIVRLADLDGAGTSADVSRYRAAFTSAAGSVVVPGNQWRRFAQVGTDDYYAIPLYVLGSGAEVGTIPAEVTGIELEFATARSAALFDGALGPGIVTAANLAAAVVARLLPASGKVGVGMLTTALLARILPTGGTDGQFLGRASGSPAWVAAPAGGGLSYARHAVSFPAESYTFSFGDTIKFSADYPEGTTKASFAGKFVVGVLSSPGAYSPNLGVVFAPLSDTQLAGFNPHEGHSQCYVTFGESKIELEADTNTAVPANARSGWSLQLSVLG